MQIDNLRDYLNTHWQSLRSDILSGTYRPQAVRKVEIPKASGGKRMLGIPTVIDRVIQQSISQWLGLKYEGDFHDNSYGFRADRNAHQAVIIMRNITSYIESTLKLKVNREKSKVSRPSQSSLLGFSFFKTQGYWHIRISAKSIERIREKLRQNTRRNTVTPMHERLTKLRQITQGWVNYFRIATNKKVMVALDKLVRRRLRVLLWKQWKTTGNRIRNLMKLGAKRWVAYQHANTRKSYTRTGISPILQTTLTNSYFTKLGYEGFADYYYWRTTHQTTLF